MNSKRFHFRDESLIAFSLFVVVAFYVTLAAAQPAPPAAPTLPDEPALPDDSPPPTEPVVEPAPTVEEDPTNQPATRFTPQAPALLPTEPNAAPLPTPMEAKPDAPKDPPLPSVDLAIALAGLGDELSLGVALAQDLEATRFQGLQAGKSNITDALERLGEPLQKTPVPGPAADPSSPMATAKDIKETVWSYQVGPFPRVELTFRGDLIQSIFVVVDGLPDPAEVAKQLRVQTFRPARVLDGKGETLGIAYPERGVMLSLRQRPQDDRQGVYSILLEPVNAELFVLRARNENPEACQNRLSDLNTAIHLNAKHPEAHGWKAKILATIGDTAGAMKHCEYAIQLDAQAVEWILLSARLHAAMGDTTKSIEQVKQVLTDQDMPEVLQAEAKLLLGNLLALAGKHDEAMPHHKAAIALAAPYRNDEYTEVRRDALRVLTYGHLAVANDIAWGNWRRKADVVPQWVKAGHRFADMLISDENEEEILAQRVQRLTLSAYAGFAEWIDPSSVSREALEHGTEMIEAAKDPLHKRRVEWELAETMYHSLVAERRRGAYKSAVEFAQIASPLFASAQKQRKLTPRESYMVGQLHFLAGSCMAIEREDHEGAVQWYNRGGHLLLEPFPAGIVPDAAELGDQLVSMGVSHWRVKQPDRAIAVTMRGAQLLQQVHAEREAGAEAEAAKKLEPSMRIAYGNLAAMLNATGRSDEARRWQTRLSSLATLSR